MRCIELKGTAHQVGQQHGEAFRHDIQHYYDFYCASKGKAPEKLHPTIRQYVETRMPEIADEIAGIADGANMTYEQLLIYNHFNVVTGCTPMFFRNSDHGPLLAQNLDCDVEERQALLVRNVNADNAYAYLCVSFVGTVWVGNCVTEKGLCGTGVSAHQQHYRTDDGTGIGIIGCQVVQSCENIDEVFDLLNSHRNVGKVGVNLYTDGTNAMLVEGTADEKFRTHVTGDFAYSSGLFTTGNVTAKDEPDYIRPKIARAKTVDDLYAAGKIEFTLDGMKKLLAHHAPDPGSICRHNRNEGSCTQSGRIMIPNEGKLLVTDGPPCTAPYEEFTLKT